MKNDLNDVVCALIQHGRDRSGAGFGSYAAGVLHAVDALLPFVDLDYAQRNGNGELGPALGRRLEDFRERMARR